MGFFSFIGSCCSAVCSCVSSACSFVSGAVGALGNMVSSLGGLAGKLIEGCWNQLGAVITSICVSVLGPVLGPIVAKMIMETIKKVVMDIAKKILGLDDKPEEVGYRIKEAEEHPENFKRPEEFPTLEEYYKYLKNEIKDEDIDREKLEANKAEYEALGVSTLSVAIGEKVGIELTGDFLGQIGICNLNSSEAIAIMQMFKDLGYSKVALTDYLQGKIESREERIQIRDGLVKLFMQNGMSEDQAYERLEKMRLCSNDYNKMVDINYPQAREEAAKKEKSLVLQQMEKEFGKYLKEEK